jgi:hypothetical protein
MQHITGSDQDSSENQSNEDDVRPHDVEHLSTLLVILSLGFFRRLSVERVSHNQLTRRLSSLPAETMLKESDGGF